GRRPAPGPPRTTSAGTEANRSWRFVVLCGVTAVAASGIAPGNREVVRPRPQRAHGFAAGRPLDSGCEGWKCPIAPKAVQGESEREAENRAVFIPRNFREKESRTAPVPRIRSARR